MPDPEPRLPAAPWPRLEELFRLGERLWEARPDVRATHGSVASWGFWCWMMYSGAGEHDELRRALYPVPEDRLRHRVVGPLSKPEFLRNGVVDANRLHACLEEAGFRFDRPGRLLELGCGCGRLLRVMARHAGALELYGADVDGDAIRWCEAELDFARFQHVSMEPPTPFEDGSFDAVYAYSVFSHLCEADQAAWLAELARVTAPGGLVVLTTQGRRLVELILDGAEDLFPTPEELRAGLPRLEREGFLFFPYGTTEVLDPEDEAFFEEWDLSRYGMTFLLESHVRRRWLEDFELVAFHEAPEGYQDFVVLRRIRGA